MIENTNKKNTDAAISKMKLYIYILGKFSVLISMPILLATVETIKHQDITIKTAFPFILK